MTYDMGTQDVRLRSLAPDDGATVLLWTNGGAIWGWQRTLLLMQTRNAEAPRPPPEVWKHFSQLYLPKWDLDFIQRVFWKKLPIGGRMGHQVGSKLCPLCHPLEDHEHPPTLQVFGIYV